MFMKNIYKSCREVLRKSKANNKKIIRRNILYSAFPIKIIQNLIYLVKRWAHIKFSDHIKNKK